LTKENEIFIQSIDLGAWNAIIKGPCIPTKEVNGELIPKEWDEIRDDEKRKVQDEYRNQPFGGRASKTRGCVFQQRKMRGSRHQRLFKENIRKAKRGSTNFKNKRFGSCLRAGKVLAPHASVTRDGNL